MLPTLERPRISHSSYWTSKSASETRQRISDYEQEKSHRPTAVVSIIDYCGRPLVVRDYRTGTWGLIQGHIEPQDPDPLATGRREAFEEAGVTDAAVAGLHPYLGETRFIEPTAENTRFPTGFNQGGYYIFVGMQLKQGADIQVDPPEGYEKELLERRWCASLEQAISVLREQPGVERVAQRTRIKVECVLIPALESIYMPHTREFMELIEYLA